MTKQPSFTPTGSGVTSLADKLSRRPPAHQPVDSHLSATVDKATKPQPRKAAPQRLDGRRTSDPGGGALRQITFLAPVDLRDRLRRRITAADVTMRDTLLDAVESQRAQLGDLIDRTRPQVRRGPLFTRRLRDTDRPVKVQISVRLAADEVRIIDQLVTEHDARDRSVLITAALEKHLADPVIE